MDIAANLTSGRRPQVPIILLYGKSGTGKTCLAAGAPGAFVIRTEDGTDDLDVMRYPRDVAEGGKGRVETFAELIAVFDWILTDTTGTAAAIQTVVLDSLSATERLVWSSVCARDGKSSIEEVGGGYGRGYTEALYEWGILLGRVEAIRHTGRASILVAHAEPIRDEDPTRESYDVWNPMLNKKARALLVAEANALLYLTQEAVTTTEDLGFGKKRAREVGSVRRKLYTSRGAGFEAKNRLGLPRSIDIPDDPMNPLVGWSKVAAALAAGRAANAQQNAQAAAVSAAVAG